VRYEHGDYRLCRTRLTRAGPFEAVEDQVEPELELVAIVIAGLQDVLGRQLSEVGVLPGELIEDGAVTPVIDRVCSLPEIPDAMRDLEAGRVRGKVVATI
jgi:hypothetical protein